ncbi:hypothetical protein E2C01_090717 [Portunus trituberculatus]|uniref:Uncharacterized protein n=1 Tax=Portunus trituberculatus TaxID=210409 RepID=A0A5B7JC13_PORTR|nr:hypothetical protein [Portunus trituberculatus]
MDTLMPTIEHEPVEGVAEGKWATPESERKQQEAGKEMIKRRQKEKTLRKQYKERHAKKEAKRREQRDMASWIEFTKALVCLCCVACSCLSVIASVVVMMYVL